MKIVKAISLLVFYICFIFIVAIPFMYEAGTLKGFWKSLGLLTVLALICIESLYWYRRIRNKERLDWLEYCKTLDNEFERKEA